MDYDKIFKVLNEKYPNIVFSGPGFGCIPVQAFGTIDDEYFYFRFRSNHGTLKIGPYDEELASLWVQRIREDAENRQAQRAEKNDELDELWDSLFDVDREVKMAEYDTDPKKNPHYLPIRVTRYASLAGKDPEDIYKGDLDTDEFIEMFSTLVDNLKVLPEEEQLNEHTRIWLYEGRAAANAYWEEALQKAKS